MIKGNQSPAPVAMHESKEVVRGREETSRRRKLTGDDVIVVRTIEEAEIKIAAEKVRREKSASRARSASMQARMSSATIPDNMTMSCTSILDRLGDESVENEKEALLRRLKELLEGEGRQVAQDLASKKRQLEEVEDDRSRRVKELKEAHRREEEMVEARQKQEQEEQASRHRGEEDRIGVEIRKLEDELERLAAPSQLLSSLSCSSSNPASQSSPLPPVKAE